MKQTLRLELSKAFKNKFFMIALMIGIILSLSSAIINIFQQLRLWENWDKILVVDGIYVKDRRLPASTLYNTWIGGEFSTVGSSLFYFLLPLLAVIPYGWSLSSERNSGYTKTIVIRSGRKAYFAAKYIAAFLAGGCVILIPLVINLATVACFVPARMPDVNYSIYYAVFRKNLWSWFFYNLPLLYVCFYILLDFIFAGLWATISLSLSFTIKNRVSVLVLPFIFLIFMQYITRLIFAWRIYIEVSPFNFLRGVQTENISSGYIIALELFLILAFSFALIIVRGMRDDIL